MPTMTKPDFKPAADFLRRRWWVLLLAALALAVPFVLEFAVGRGPIPTWQSLYHAAGLDTDTLPKAAQAETSVVVLDVGQGDAVLLIQDGAYCLIDTGPAETSDLLADDLHQLGVDTLTYLVLTHPHADHTGGARQVLADFSVDTLLLPYWDTAAYPVQDGTYIPDWPRSLLESAAENGTAVVTAQNGQEYPLGGGALTVLHGGLLSGGEPPALTENVNNVSLCLLFCAGDFRFLDTGDAEKEVEQALADTYGPSLQATLFKAGHHGSSTSNTLPFLQLVHPRAVAISCGADNDYGHPHTEALQSFAAVNADVFRTDTQGTLWFAWHSGELTVTTSESTQNAA